MAHYVFLLLIPVVAILILLWLSKNGVTREKMNEKLQEERFKANLQSILSHRGSQKTKSTEEIRMSYRSLGLMKSTEEIRMSYRHQKIERYVRMHSLQPDELTGDYVYFDAKI